MAEHSVVLYEPAPRFGHVAAAIERKLYVWGGLRRDTPKLHDAGPRGPSKTAFVNVVDVLDIQVNLYFTSLH